MFLKSIRVLLFMAIALSGIDCDGRLSKERCYAYYGGEKLLLKRTYYDKGSKLLIQSERTYLVVEDSLLGHGFGNLYYENGNLEYFANYYRGKKVGSVWEYYETGRIKKYWFYNPIGQAIYGIEFDFNGNVIKEEGVEQRCPQIISKDLPGNKVLLKVYSAQLPNFYKKMYLITPDSIVIDSILGSQLPFDQFEISENSGYYTVCVDYFNEYDKIYSDSTIFKIK